MHFAYGTIVDIDCRCAFGDEISRQITDIVKLLPMQKLPVLRCHRRSFEYTNHPSGTTTSSSSKVDIMHSASLITRRLASNASSVYGRDFAVLRYAKGASQPRRMLDYLILLSQAINRIAASFEHAITTNTIGCPLRGRRRQRRRRRQRPPDVLQTE